MSNAIGRLEGQLLRIGQQVTGNPLASRRELGKPLIQHVQKTYFAHETPAKMSISLAGKCYLSVIFGSLVINITRTNSSVLALFWLFTSMTFRAPRLGAGVVNSRADGAKTWRETGGLEGVMEVGIRDSGSSVDQLPLLARCKLTAYRLSNSAALRAKPVISDSSRTWSMERSWLSSFSIPKK